jgi:hypothetical protein
MKFKALDTMTRRAVDGVSRRASLATLGGAALAVAARPDVSEAKKKQSCGKKQKKKCNNVESACNTTGAVLCGDPPDPQCLTTLAFCCQQCFSDQFLS